MTTVQLKRWKCHKVVGAAKIVDTYVKQTPTGTLQVLHLDPAHAESSEDSAPYIEMPSEWQRSNPDVIGGYFVTYEDGYTAWSPASAFERGYTELPTEQQNAEVSDAGLPKHPAIENVLKFFSYGHLPPKLQEISKPFCELATQCADRAPDSQETTVALRKLLEAKDAAVRAAL